MTAADILDAAAALIEPEGRWTQGTWAKDADGYDCDPDSSEAVCWCALGAIEAISSDIADVEAIKLLTTHLGQPVDTWQDAGPRTQAQVVAALREAAAVARAGR